MVTDTGAMPANGHPGSEQSSRVESAAVARPPRLRRRGLLGVGIAIVALAGAGGAWLFTAATDTHAVLAAAHHVTRGSVIGEADLAVAHITLDPALRPVPATSLDQVVGKRAALDLPGGSIVTSDAVTDAGVPAAGDELVGLAVTPLQLPVEPLLPGDTVRVVDVPREQDDPPGGEPRSTTATVVTVGAVDETGRLVRVQLLNANLPLVVDDESQLVSGVQPKLPA